MINLTSVKFKNTDWHVYHALHFGLLNKFCYTDLQKRLNLQRPRQIVLED